MRHPDLDYMMAIERHKDDLRAAEQYRLVKEALKNREPRVSFSFRPAALALSRALAYLGERLLDWSARLQCRYRALASGPEGQPEPCA